MSAVFGTACFSQQMSARGLNRFRKGEAVFTVHDEDRSCRPSGMRTPAMIKPVDDLIHSDRKRTIMEDS